MKINIRDVFEKEEKNVRIHTNDRLDIDEVFAEAVIDETDTEQKLTVDITDKLEIGVQDDAEEGMKFAVSLYQRLMPAVRKDT